MEVITIDVGNIVVCDMCSKDFTDSYESGGILFQSKAVGPCCADKIEKSAIKYNETKHIHARCPDGLGFADWVRNAIR